MSQHTIGFFIIPAHNLDELQRVHELFLESVREDAPEADLLENQRYVRARELALHMVEQSDEHSWSALNNVTEYLEERAWKESVWLIRPEECAARMRELDAFEELRGGVEGVVRMLIQHREEMEAADRAMYALLRQMLARAMAEDAALFWASFDPKAEEWAEKKRERQRWEREARARRERGAIQVEFQGRVIHDDDLGARVDPMSPERRPFETPELVIVPARELPRLIGIDRASARMSEDYRRMEQALEVAARYKLEAALVAHDEVGFQTLGEQAAWQVLATEALGLAEDDDALGKAVFSAQETRALAEALVRWIDEKGGRDQAIEYIVAHSASPHRGMAERVYDALVRLLATAREREAALLVLQHFDT